MKKLILLCLSLLMTAGCSSNENAVFREKIVPDFEQIISGDNEVFKAYENAAAAARTFAENPTEENKEAFRAAADESDRAAKENASIQSNIGDEEYAVMDKLSLPRTDYDYLFDAHASSMTGLSDWSAVTERIEEGADAEELEHLISSQECRLELEKVYLIYGAMDLVVDIDEDDAEYFKEMIYKYPRVIPENCEWLTDHEEIADAYNARLDEIEEKINAEQEYLNNLLNEQRKAETQLTD